MTRRLTRPAEPTGLSRYLPVINAARSYRRAFLRPDILAGLTAWAMVVPEGIGYASIAGMPPEAALYAAVLGTVAYFLFGTSHEVTVGPSSALAIMSASALGTVGISQSSSDWVATAGALAILVGILALAAGLLRLGFINNFISKPVLDGFVAGLALNILVGQIPKFLGFSLGGDLNFFETLAETVRSVEKTSGYTLLVGLASIALLIGLHRISARIPAALITVGASVIGVVLFGLTDRGVAVIGHIPSGFPTPEVPSVGLDTMGSLLPAALGIALVAYAETLSGGRTFAVRRQYRIDPDQEFIALGAANIGSGFFGGFAVNGSLSRTKLKYDAGVKTQFSTLYTGIAVVITLVALTWLFEDLAEATIAAIVIHAVAPLVRPSTWPRLWRTARLEFFAAMGAALVTMTFGEVQGLFFGVIVAIIMLTVRASRASINELGYLPDADTYAEIDSHPEAVRVPSVLILRAAANPSFSNAASFHDAIVDAVYAADPSPTDVVLDCDIVSSIDVTVASTFERLVPELQALGVHTRLARVDPAVRQELNAHGLDSVLDDESLHLTIRDAVDAAR